MAKKETITVSNITFSADQVESVVIKVDGRTIEIGAKESEGSKIGFHSREE